MMAEEKLLRHNIAKSDPKKIYELFESWPQKAEETLKKQVSLTSKRYERVVYLAVGGSATGGDMISDWFLSSGGPEVSVFRGGLPKLELRNALVIICSTSGDTIETLRMAEVVKGLHSDVVTISHNGKLKEMADREGLVHVEIDLAQAPRYSLPYSLFASLTVLRSASLLEGIESELDETIAGLKEVARSINSDSPIADNLAKQVAQAIGDREPCIYASSVTKSVARRFKNSLNENTKRHARFDSAPDLFHNEVEAWESTDASQHPVILRREEEPAFEARALDAFSAMLKSRNIDTTRVDAPSQGNLSQLVNLCYALDFASYYAAILSGVNPFPITLIDELKKSR